ncbi:hypothetical protein BDW22DRAFT_1356798 [Trametopsis cervina]|nr:hypothetical protein BDW22DRAFT_1356798 [Trametopsis cervina]
MCAQDMRAFMGKYINLTNLKNVLLYFFSALLIYKIATRLDPTAMVGNVLADASEAATTTLRTVIFGPFKLVFASPGWLYRQGEQLLRDIVAAFWFLPLFTQIAFRLLGAYILLRYISPCIFFIFVTWPLLWLFDEASAPSELTPNQADHDVPITFGPDPTTWSGAAKMTGCPWSKPSD